MKVEIKKSLSSEKLFIEGKEICDLTKFVIRDDMNMEVHFKVDEVKVSWDDVEK